MTISLRPYSLDDLPPVTKWLVAGSFAGWMLELAFGATLNQYLGLVPIRVMGRGWYWQLLTYIFLHGSFWHFLFNAFMTWTLGGVLEPELGSRRFLLYFLLCGAAAGFCTVVVSPGSLRPVIGASGAIYGLLYAYSALHPGHTIYMYFLFLMTVRQFVIIMAAMSLVLSFATPNSAVANFTHLSGLAAGWLYFAIRGFLRRGPDLPALEPGELGIRAAELWTRATGNKSRFTHRSFFYRMFDPLARKDQDDEGARARVDAILEKISREGEGSLTATERMELDQYAKRHGGTA